jgi:hypothetical protein
MSESAFFQSVREFKLPKSMAHIPVPVAMSKTLCKPPGRSFIGAL